LVQVFDFRVLVCNGATPFNTVQELLGIRVPNPFRLGNLEWSVGMADVNGRRLAVAGWNLPLAGR
jgi:hypothetical protein